MRNGGNAPSRVSAPPVVIPLPEATSAYSSASSTGTAAVAVSVAIAIMHLTRTLHPPGGATALIAVIGGDSVHQLGYL